MSTGGKFLTLVFISLIFVSLGILWGSSRFYDGSSSAGNFYKGLPKEGKRLADSPESLWGRIEALPTAQGTHRLVDAEGEILALLESPKIDLDFLGGMEVEVEGKLLKTVEGNVKLIRVEKVKFR